MRIGVPYKVVGGTRFYDRREVKDAMAYLRAVVNPADEVSIKRVLNVPKRGIGDASVGQARRLRRGRRGSVHRGAAPCRRRRGQRTGRRGHRAASSSCSTRVVRASRSDAAAGRPAPGGARAPRLPRRAGGGGHRRVDRRLENLGELVGSAQRVRARSTSSSSRCRSWPTPTSIDDDDSQVVLMTLHSAKGLEFPVVFLIGAEEGVFPHIRRSPSRTSWRRSAASPTSASPGRRERLYITHAWSRSLFGATQYNPPSRFLEEIPPSSSTRAAAPQDRTARASSRDQHDGWRDRRAAGAVGRRRRRRRRPRPTASGSWRPRSPPAAGGAAADERAGARPASSATTSTHPRSARASSSTSAAKASRAEATVRFPGVGTKVFSLAWSPLTKL